MLAGAEPAKPAVLAYAMTYFVLGELDQGFELLTKAFDDRQYVSLIACDPKWDIVRDDPATVLAKVRERLGDPNTHVIITTGGTGISSRDSTYEAIEGLLEKQLTGFGELFRMLSFQEIGSAAMMSRATAGTVGRKAIFILPGSPDAVRLGMTRLILPELSHVVQQLKK